MEYSTKTGPTLTNAKTGFHNALVKSPHHDAIIQKLTELRAANLRLNLAQFHAEYVEPVVPGFSYKAFHRYVKALIDRAIIVGTDEKQLAEQGIPPVPSEAAAKFQEIFVNSAKATREGLALALGIGMQTLEGIANGTINMSPKEKADLLFKAMKAQDSRMAATARIRQDIRDQAVFDQVFGDAAYEEENS